MVEERFPRLGEFVEPFRVKPGSTVVLAKDFDPKHYADFL